MMTCVELKLAHPCCPDRSKEAASTAADDDFYRFETCTDPYGPDRFKEAASTAADDNLHRIVLKISIYQANSMSQFHLASELYPY